MEHLGDYSTKFRSLSVKKLFPPVNFDGEATSVPAAFCDVASETIVTAVRVTKFEVTHYGHMYVLLRVNKIKVSEIALRNTSDAHVLSFVQSFRA